MFTRIVVLLTALPMLAPPGLCLCRLLEGGRSAPATAESEPAPRPENHCPCCEPPAPAEPADNAPAQSAPPECPGCRSAALTKPEAPANTADMAAPDWTAHTDLTPIPLRARQAPTPALSTAAAPLYLLFRDLLC